MVILLVWVGEQLGANWVDIRAMLQPFDTLMIVLVILAGGCSCGGASGCPVSLAGRLTMMRRHLRPRRSPTSRPRADRETSR